MSKAFWLLNTETSEIDMRLQSNTPREAALKAATRQKTDICLIEASMGKVHLFKGERILRTRRSACGKQKYNIQTGG